MIRPLIGVSTYWEPQARWGRWSLPAALLPAGYPAHVQRAGGLAVLLPPDDPALATEAVRRLDGLVVAGGPDVDPQRYGAPRDPRTGPPATARDAWESALVTAALEHGTPLLGICRGMHLLNVALGGTLHQHLPDVVGHHGHTGPPGEFGSHPVRSVPGTLVGRIQPGVCTVPTFHHQAVDVLGAGLRASAHADDGTVEAVEHTGGGFAVGVEWHPEMGDDPRVFRALVDAAAQPPVAASNAAVSTPGASTSDGPYQVR